VALNKKFAAIAGGVTAVGATVALTAGTFSYFSDSETGPANAIKFGTLDLVAQEGAAQQVINVGNAKPGDPVLDRVPFSFHNAGTIDGALRIRFVPTHTNGTPEQIAAYENAVLITLEGVDGFVDNKPYTLAQAADITEDGRWIFNLLHDGEESGRDTKGFPVTVTIDPKAGNDVQGLIGGFTLEADLVQSDGSGKPAQFPAPSFQQPALPKK
jgi:hypothetical protein